MRVYSYRGISYVIVDQTVDPNGFRAWLFGQTQPVVPDVEAAYSWDYELYLQLRLKKT